MPSASGLSAFRIIEAVEQAGLKSLPPGVAEKFSQYFDLLQQWNSKLNLTAIRSPEGTLHRHFVECIFCAQELPAGISTLLDYGSGAGFPGIPISLCRLEIRVTLAESQGKKESFLHEAVRVLGLDAKVHGGRVEELPHGQSYDAVSLRAVDKMQEAISKAVERVATHGWLVLMASGVSVTVPEGFIASESAIPGLQAGVLILARRE